MKRKAGWARSPAQRPFPAEKSDAIEKLPLTRPDFISAFRIPMVVGSLQGRIPLQVNPIGLFGGYVALEAVLVEIGGHIFLGIFGLK